MSILPQADPVANSRRRESRFPGRVRPLPHNSWLLLTLSWSPAGAADWHASCPPLSRVEDIDALTRLAPDLSWSRPTRQEFPSPSHEGHHAQKAQTLRRPAGHDQTRSSTPSAARILDPVRCPVLSWTVSACSGAVRVADPAATTGLRGPGLGRAAARLGRRGPLLRHPRPLRRRRSARTTSTSTAAPRAPSTAATCAACTEQLDEIADLGVTAIWITPVVKNIDGFVTGAGFPDWAYHGYWADDFTSLDPRFGSEAGAGRRSSRPCHARGIKVLLDVVYNHAGYDSQLPDRPGDAGLVPHRGGGHLRPGRPDLAASPGLPDLRTELPEVADYLLDGAPRPGRARSGLDGFRLDTVKHVDHEFWQEHRRRTRERLGDGLLPARRGLGRRRAACSIPGSPTTRWTPASTSGSRAARWRSSRAGAARWPSTATWRSAQGACRATTSRTTSRRTTCRARSTSCGATSAASVSPPSSSSPRIGIPVIYYGEEVGRPGGDWPDNRSDMPWGERDVLPGHGPAARRGAARGLPPVDRHPARPPGALARHPRGLVQRRRPAGLRPPATPQTGDAVVVAVNRGERAGRGGVRRARRRGAAREVRDAWRAQRPVDRRRATRYGSSVRAAGRRDPVAGRRASARPEGRADGRGRARRASPSASATSRSSSSSTSRSRTTSSWSWSGPRAAASRRRCA